MEEKNKSLILYIWEYKKLKISSKGVDDIFCNVSLQNLPNSEEIEKILMHIINKIDKDSLIEFNYLSLSNTLNKKRKKQTQKKWNCICKNNWGLNNDVLKLIQNYSEEFCSEYIKNIKNKLINYSITLLDKIVNENIIDLNWYDCSQPDYRWAINTIQECKERKNKLEKIRIEY